LNILVVHYSVVFNLRIESFLDLSLATGTLRNGNVEANTQEHQSTLEGLHSHIRRYSQSLY